MAVSKKAVTLKDVARLAETTPMTVSNVLNNRAGSVGPELSARKSTLPTLSASHRSLV